MSKQMQTSLLDWKFEDFYDLFMFDIEEDLLTENLPKLEEKYEGESEDDSRKRSLRYVDAIKKWMDRFSEGMELWHDKLKDTKKEIISLYKEKTTEKESTFMKELEDYFNEKT